MALDASIFARFQPKSVAEFDSEYAVAQNAKADRQVNALKLLGAQRGERASAQDETDANAFKTLAMNPTYATDSSGLVKEATSKGLIKPAMAYQKQIDDRAKGQADIDAIKNKARLEKAQTDHANATAIGNAYTGVAQDPAMFNHTTDVLVASGHMAPEMAKTFKDAVTQDPSQGPKIAQVWSNVAIQAKDQLTKYFQQTNGGENTIVGIDPRTNAAKVVQSSTVTATPENTRLVNKEAKDREYSLSDYARNRADKLTDATAEAAKPDKPEKPYFTPVQTASGVMAFNARSGKMEPVLVDGSNVVGSQSDPTLQGAVAKAKSGAKAEVQKSVDSDKENKRSDQLLIALDKADSLLLSKPTNSGVGTIVDAIGRATGVSSNSAQKASELETLSGWMTTNVPRMEGPQSNIDVNNYQIMAAKVGDRTIPVPERQAAAKVIRELQLKYKALNDSAIAKPDAIKSTEQKYDAVNMADVMNMVEASKKRGKNMTREQVIEGYRKMGIEVK